MHPALSQTLRYAALLLLAAVIAGNTAFAQKDPEHNSKPTTTPVDRPRTTVVTSPTTGALSVVAGLAGAKVQLFTVSAKGKATPKNTLTADTDGNATFSSLKPGLYRVVVSSPDFDDATQEVKIVAGKAETVSGKPRPRFGYLVLVRPELTEDTVIEVDGERVASSEIHRGADGTAWIKQPLGKHQLRILKPGFEPYVKESDVEPGAEAMVAPSMERQWASLVVKGAEGTRVYLDGAPAGIIPSTGQFELPHLVPGQGYDLRFELEDYQPLTRSVRVENGAANTVDAVLEQVPTNGLFEDSFFSGLAAWDAPPSWSAENGVLSVRGAGMGVARESRYRDFEMVFSLRLATPNGAAWTLRTKDDKNFYLFVFGGPGGRYPNQFRAYVVRDGIVDPAAPATTLPIVEPLATNETYRIRIHAEGNVIQQWITPSLTGEEVSIGLFTDVKRSFSFGRIGFAAPFGESFQVNGLSVRPTVTH